jgi:hypothetical protein
MKKKRDSYKEDLIRYQISPQVPSKSHHHIRHSVYALIIGCTMVFFTWLLADNPFAIKQPFLRFLAYSITTTLPSLVTLIPAFIVPKDAYFPPWIPYAIAFLVYAGLAFLVIHIYNKTIDERKALFIKKVAITIALFILWSFTIMMIINYR